MIFKLISLFSRRYKYLKIFLKPGKDWWHFPFLPHAQVKIKPMPLARFFYVKSFNVCIKINSNYSLIVKIKWANLWEVVNN